MARSSWPGAAVADTDRIPVLVFASSFRLGGSERQAVELLRHLDRRRFAPVVACFEAEGPLLEELPEDVLPPRSFSLVRFAHASTLAQAVRFVGLLRRSRIQVVQTFDFYSNVFALPLARLCGVPAVVGARREGPGQRARRHRRWEHLCFRAAHAVVANAALLEDHLVSEGGVPEEKVRVIHNALDLSRFDTLAKTGDSAVAADDEPDPSLVRMGVLGNLRPEKGHLHLLEALASMAELDTEVRVYLAGEGPERETIETRISELGLDRIVHLLGTVTNAPAFLAAMDVVVLPSLEEGLPNAVIESMAAAKPVVATRVGGVPELVEPGVTGTLVEPARPEALAAALLDILKSGSMRERMGSAARRRVENRFDSGRASRQFEELYDELLARNTSRGELRARTG